VCCMSGKKLILFFFSIFLLFSSVNIKSQAGDSLYYIDPNAFVAREIFNKKIVMLGDGGHHQPAVYHYVFGTLYKWLEICKNKPEDENLTLIIENDSLFPNLLTKYIKDGDMQALVEKGSGFYLEDLEYYTNLRKFSFTIDSLNKYREKKISFKVKAFEQTVERLLSISHKEHQLWFVNERDSVSAEGVINYINSNPNERILIFYGSAHLIDNRISKKIMGGTDVLTEEESKGYFLAYYLEQKFGAENVLKIVPWSSTSYFKKQDFPYPGRKSFIAKSEDLGIPDSLVTGSDYIYFIQYDYLPLIEGGRICSKVILNNNIEHIKYVQPFRPSYISDMEYYRSLYNIHYITGKFMKDDSLSEQLKSISDFNPTDFLYSNRFESELLPLNYVIPQIIGFFSVYGVDASKDSIMILLNRFKDMSSMFLMQRAKFTNSIGIYWIGYPDEKIKAKEYLVKFSGEDFTEPEKYLQWYRMKYYGYEY
jgi:hypothetical protein